MPITVANQRTIHIHREAAKYDFLGIKNENWQAASRTLGAHGLLLYLYFKIYFLFLFNFYTLTKYLNSYKYSY